MSHRVSLDELRKARCVLVGEEPTLGRPMRIIVAMGSDGAPRVYQNECMHVAIPLGLFAESIEEDGTLLCGTHGARYRIDDGYCFEGPCVGQNLDELPFDVVDGWVVLR